jgi:hypothetical protein
MAAQSDTAALGPITLARAADHVAKNSSSAAEAIAHAISVGQACANSEADTEASVRSLMAA